MPKLARLEILVLFGFQCGKRLLLILVMRLGVRMHANTQIIASTHYPSYN